MSGGPQAGGCCVGTRGQRSVGESEIRNSKSETIPNQTWLCPSAPAKEDTRAYMPNVTGATGTDRHGTVDAAYVVSPPGFEAWRELFVQDRLLIGSYTYNGWMGVPASSPRGSLVFATNLYDGPEIFHVEAQIGSPSRTPVLGDGVMPIAFPRAHDPPPTDLVAALGIDIAVDAHYSTRGLFWYCIPRHGSRPGRPPREHPPSAFLPGAINMGFFDGHAEQVPLERLWQLHWHQDYVPPARRPGMPP
jgi:prepilin-type processing-associated H-X9-DG protein